MRKQNKQHAVESIFSDNPFVDDFMDWMGSPEGQQSIEIDDTLWEALRTCSSTPNSASSYGLTRSGLTSVNRCDASKKSIQTCPTARSKTICYTGSRGTTPRKAIPRRNYGSLTDSPGDGSLTICVTPSHRKIGNELATLEIASDRRETGGKVRSRCRSAGGHERRQARSDWPDASGAGRATPAASASVCRIFKALHGPPRTAAENHGLRYRPPVTARHPCRLRRRIVLD